MFYTAGPQNILVGICIGAFGVKCSVVMIEFQCTDFVAPVDPNVTGDPNVLGYMVLVCTSLGEISMNT